MMSYLLRRLLRSAIVIVGVSSLVFVSVRLSGDPVPLLLPPEATRQEVEALRTELGLDRPLYVQYLIFWRRVVRGDLGQSLRYKRSASDLVLERLPATLQLAFVAFIFAAGLGVPLGVLAAVRRGLAIDRVLMGVTLIGQSMPAFWLGIAFILVFSLRLHLLPTSGRGSFAHLIMPALTVGFLPFSMIARLSRSAVLDVSRQDYVRTALAKGLAKVRVVGRHILKNAAIPVVTIMGLQLGTLLTSAVVTETVFAWPGIGRLAVEAVQNRDYPVVQAVVFAAAIIYVSLNLVVDSVYTRLDPRIRLDSAAPRERR
jgi:peptide/nickel transport system permease protein